MTTSTTLVIYADKMSTIRTHISRFRDAVHIFRKDYDGDIWMRMNAYSILFASSKRRIEIERSCFDEYNFPYGTEFYSIRFPINTLDAITNDTTDITFLAPNPSVIIEVGTEDDVTTVELPAGKPRRLRDDDYLCFYDGDMSFMRDMGDNIAVQWAPTKLRLISEHLVMLLRHTCEKQYEDIPIAVRNLRIISAQYPHGAPRKSIKGLCSGYTMFGGCRRINPAAIPTIKALSNWGSEHTIECDTDKPFHMRSADDYIAIDIFAEW